MAIISCNPVGVSADRDDEGQRTYTLISEVVTDSIATGPYTFFEDSSFLPQIGDTWRFLISGPGSAEEDSDAYCTPNMKISPKGELSSHEEEVAGTPPRFFWVVEQQFTTIPLTRCQNNSIKNPLNEPQKISGTFIKAIEEATRDYWNNPIMSSSFEQLRGPEVEFDASYPSVRIEQNVADLGLPTIASMVDTVNGNVMWGVSARCVKLTNVTWERKIYGKCNFYFTRVFDFEINFKTWDKWVLDQGTKCLHGKWDPDTGAWVLSPVDHSGTMPVATNPQHFSRYKDRSGENARCVLDGDGLPAESRIMTSPATGSGGAVSGSPFWWLVMKYGQSNFFNLGIPTDLADPEA